MRVEGVIVYAEASAVLAWLLGAEGGEEAGAVLAEAEAVVASDLTLVECERVLVRAWGSGLMTEAEGADHRAALARVAAHWTRLRLDEAAVERAGRPFPVEPVRPLEALHLGSALAARSAVPGLRLLTLDPRVRENARRLGLAPLP